MSDEWPWRAAGWSRPRRRLSCCLCVFFFSSISTSLVAPLPAAGDARRRYSGFVKAQPRSARRTSSSFPSRCPRQPARLQRHPQRHQVLVLEVRLRACARGWCAQRQGSTAYSRAVSLAEAREATEKERCGEQRRSARRQASRARGARASSAELSTRDASATAASAAVCWSTRPAAPTRSARAATLCAGPSSCCEERGVGSGPRIREERRYSFICVTAHRWQLAGCCPPLKASVPRRLVRVCDIAAPRALAGIGSPSQVPLSGHTRTPCCT